ncbi:hypothetical protein O3P69_001809 [Scylla paramamosain]|uniref:Protein kinase domain-containing protein n=1 Tax=Scylla paramamosain TaxID=85552 RepID=A0AAW0V3P2_SCYPA
MTPAKNNNTSKAMEQQPPNKAFKRIMDSPSRHEECPAMKKKRRHSAVPPALPTIMTVADPKRKGPATALTVYEYCPCLLKRRKIPSPSPHEEFTVVTKKHSHSNADQETRQREGVSAAAAQAWRSSPQDKRRQRDRQPGDQLLASGSNGSCHLAVDPNTRQPLVIKTFPRHGLDGLATEAINMHELQLPGVCVPTRHFITRFAGITVPQYFVLTKPSFADAISVFLQIARTLQQMLEKGFAHNDIKGDSVCIQVDNNAPKVTITELGLARRVGTTRIYQHTSDTDMFPWLAPELLLHTHPCGEASDVYSLAQFLQEELRPPENTLGQSPSLAVLNSWIGRAQRLNPSKRPHPSALIDLLQLLHEQAMRTPRSEAPHSD